MLYGDIILIGSQHFMRYLIVAMHGSSIFASTHTKKLKLIKCVYQSYPVSGQDGSKILIMRLMISQNF